MTRRTPAYCLIFLVLLFQSSNGLSCYAQSDQDKALADALVHWNTKCFPKGCLIETDILRGASDDPPDAKDFREYISLNVAMLRAGRKPAYFTFQVDPRAQQDQGIFITFSKTVMTNGQWDVQLDPEGPSRLPISGCDENACTVRVPLGIVEDGPDTHRMDLLQKFLGSNHMLVLYVRGGRTYRTMVLLSSFKSEYARVMEKELPPVEQPAQSVSPPAH